MSEIINAHVFIVPNSILKAQEYTDLERAEAVYGVVIDQSDLLVQTWTLNPDDGSDGGNNFECHGVNRDEKRLFPSRAPAKLFAGKKEGDIVEFEGEYGKFRIILKQAGYRYQQFGLFHEVLEGLVSNYLKEEHHERSSQQHSH